MYNTTKPYINKVLEMIRTTWHTHWCDIREGVYPIVQMKHNNPHIDHTDGIGTKGYYHWQQKTFKEAAIDAFAMNANDLAMAGAFNLCKMQNHIFLPEDSDDTVYTIVEKLVQLSKKYDMAMTGGETSIHMNMNGMDISVTMTGIAQPECTAATYPRIGNMYAIGDVLVGLPSDGLHSNGFTLVHNTLGGFRPEYVVPTKIYVEKIRQLYNCVGAMNHITGGAYTKLKPYLPQNADAEFRFKEPAQIFIDLFNAGINSETMYKTFNCGYGFVLGVPEQYLDYVIKEGGEIIGNVLPGTGRVCLKSAFDGEIITY